MLKSIIAVLKKLDGLSVLVGMLVGSAIGLMLFSYMVPGGEKMIGLYHHAVAKQISAKNTEAFTTHMSGNGSHAMENMASNPYVMNPIRSEKQFLEEMKLHHEAAIVMAEQVLTLPQIHKEVKALAEAIIKAQKQEVESMSLWLKNFTW